MDGRMDGRTEGWTDGRTDGRTEKLIWGGLGNLWFLQVNELNIFLIAPYPPPLIGPYHYCAMPDEEYDLMSDEVRNIILKAAPHARI